jgi:flagellar L-ring protein FlgH
VTNRTQTRVSHIGRFLAGGVAVLLCFAAGAEAKAKKPKFENLRNQYIARVQQQALPPEAPQTGSLWSPGAALLDMTGDYKARKLNDTIIIVVSESTSATSSGDVSQNREFSANSAITGLGGHVSTGGVDPIVIANSSRKLKGTGASNSASQVQTSLTGQVVAVFPNGNMVVEAERKIVLNSQNETMVVRGVVRPGDITYGNTISSSSLMNLELELKGKGLVSDATRQPNFVTRLLWKIIGF